MNASVDAQNGPKPDDEGMFGIDVYDVPFSPRESAHVPSSPTMDFSEVLVELPENVFLTDRGLRKWCPHCGKTKNLEEFPESTVAEWGRRRYCFKCGGARRKRDD